MNKLTANYLFLVNQTESDIPRIKRSSLDLLEKMSAEWKTLKARADEIAANEIPSLNKRLWDLGYGAIWKN